MKWVLRIAALTIGLIGAVGLIGFFLPVSHEASRSAELAKPPDVVFALMANPDSYREWWSEADVRSEVVERVPPSKIVTRIVGETQFGGTWTIEIAPTPAGSRMTITERGEIYNPVFRALMKFVFGYTATMDSCLEAARKRLS
jgi:hypothetical protein